MIGTGKVKGDIIYFDLSEVSTTGYAKKLTRSASAVTSFGSGVTMKPMAGNGEAIEQEKIVLLKAFISHSMESQDGIVHLGSLFG